MGDEFFTVDKYTIFMNKEIVNKIDNIEIFYQYGISKSGFRVLTDINWKLKYKYEPWAKPSNL